MKSYFLFVAFGLAIQHSSPDAHTDKNPHHKSSEKGTCAVDWTKIRTIIRSWH